MSVQSISLDKIRAEIQAQPRAAMLTDEVAHYSEAMGRGDVFPPLVVYFDGSVYWLADGFHRYHAANGLGLAEFECDVREGGLRDAILHSVGANEAHGIRRTSEDKRRAVKRLLDDPEWSIWSDSEIARRCSVSRPLVADLRALTCNSACEPRTYTTKHGTVSTMATANIGRRDPAPQTERRELPPNFAELTPVPAATYTQGNASVFNDLIDVRRLVRRHPSPEAAVAQFPDRVRHSFTAEDFDALADWFARAADAWRQHERTRHVAAE